LLDNSRDRRLCGVLFAEHNLGGVARDEVERLQRELHEAVEKLGARMDLKLSALERLLETTLHLSSSDTPAP
jgi:hypothetical protein